MLPIAMPLAGNGRPALATEPQAGIHLLTQFSQMSFCPVFSIWAAGLQECLAQIAPETASFLLVLIRPFYPESPPHV